MEQRYVTGKKPVCSSLPARGVFGRGRRYRDQGPSSYEANPYYEHCERARYLNHELDGPSRFENLEYCRADLIRKLDELKDHLSRSCEVTEKPGRRVAAENQGLASSHGVYKHDVVYPYSSQDSRFVPRTDAYRSGVRDLHFHRGYPGEFVSYDNPQSQFLHWHDHERFSGCCGNVNHGQFVPERDFHKSTCSCVHCFDKNWDSPFNSPCLYNQRPHHAPDYLHRTGHRPRGVSPHSQPSLTPNSTELDSVNDGIHQNSARKMEQVRRNVHTLHPVAGGAPFIACSSCFESLKLPRKHILSTKRQHKMKCGACSSIIVFEVANKASTLPVSVSVDHLATEMNENVCAGSSPVDKNACSDSNVESLHKISPADNESNSGLSENLQMPNTEKDGSSSTEIESFLHPISSTEECPDHNPANIAVVNHGEDMNKGTISEFESNVSWQNSVRDSAVSTDIDMSSKEFPKSFTSLDSVDENRGRQLRDDRSSESSSRGHTNNSSLESIKLSENVEVGPSQVFVNWHLIPEDLVQKAELLAGPIQPGDYWYDIRAGFWGVMGHPCLGIIMPNIEEFNYPMPVNCAAGNTGVFVNGRELHQKDLDLLVGRGLPQTKQRSYLIDISGDVFDEDTGEELDNIGKLAPTVERVKHGFGMKVPRFISRFQG